MFIEAIIKLVFPKAPQWLGTLIGASLPVIHQMVVKLKDIDTMRGTEKRQFVVTEASAVIDHAFDDVPEWTDLTEAQRDRIIGGLAELSLFISTVSGDSNPRKTKRLLKKSLNKLG